MFTSVFFPCLLLRPELFATEHAHVRMLSVLQMVFSKPLEREELLTSTDVATIFPSLDEIIEVHCECKSMNSSTTLCPSSCKKKNRKCLPESKCLRLQTQTFIVSFSRGREEFLSRKSGKSSIWSNFFYCLLFQITFI